jgi:hypothetical protein
MKAKVGNVGVFALKVFRGCSEIMALFKTLWKIPIIPTV